ncbi:twin-arginine translocation pathway signal [Wielerella bovis]|uniref:twin-arginine translocation pathway signal n=1 Tax=Wielerella bovis TaxID=2917790 RepID=UPI00201971A2|nr:twin-arginine translocation pathway signal [Wielerella bovis]ULJ59324.1 twin-arginine translocation pathway signal [Wielerella bovis]
MNRRQFLSYSATLTATATASWFGYQHINRPPTITLHKIGLPLAHLLRDKQIPTTATQAHHCETLILGSGAAALSAAWHFSRNGYHNYMITEGFERNGNNAGFISGSLKAPTGAHYLAQPSAESAHVRQMLADLGILQGYDKQGNPIYREQDLVFAPDERVFAHGKWHDGLLPKHDADTKRFFQFIQTINHLRGSDGKKIFAIPIIHSSQDAQWRKLDTLTFAAWLKQQRYQSPILLWYLDYCCRDDYGQGIEQVSAFAGLHYFAGRGNDHAAVLTWEDGLNHISEQLRQFIQLKQQKTLPNTQNLVFRQPESFPYVAVQIDENSDNVRVLLRHTETGDTRLIHAQNVICAMPLMIAKYILKQPENYGLHTFRLPDYAPWLVSNFVLHSFPTEPAHTELAWDNVVYGSRGLGYVVATHQQIRVARPSQTAFTAYTALNHDTPQAIRAWLLNAQPRDVLPFAAQDLLAVYGKRFWQHVSHVEISARAHAMSVPSVGYLSAPLLQKIQMHQSRILFAHSDMSGYSVFEEAAFWGMEAAKKILAEQ